MLLRTTPAVLAALSNDDWTLVGLGMGVVFAGLIALILICYLLAAAFGGNAKAAPKQPQKTVSTAPAAAANTIENRSELAAAIAVAIAQEMGCEPEGLRIHSIRKIG